MMSENNTQNLQSKKRSFLISSIVSSVIIIGILVFITLFAYDSPFVYDMTKDKIFTLSDQSVDMLENLDESVEIGVVSPRGSEDIFVKSLLDVYEKSSNGMIKTEFIDAELEPALLAKYSLNVAAVTNGTIIVKSADRTKLVNVVSLYTTTQMGNSFSGEKQITGAIKYVTADVLPKIYFLEGHGESDILTDFSKIKAYLEFAAYSVESLNLTRDKGIPDDAELLVCSSPKSDYSVEDIKYLSDYTANGGSVIYLIDVLSSSSEITRLNAFIADQGVLVENNLVVEEDPDTYFGDIKTILIPYLSSHEITASIIESKSNVIFPNAMALKPNKEAGDNVRVGTIAQSSRNSWVRYDLNIQTTEYTPEDTLGPANLALFAIKEATADVVESRVIVFGSSYFLSNDNVEMQSNFDIFMNSVNWVTENNAKNLIYPKLLNADLLYMTGSDFTRLAVLVILVIPMIVFAAAFFVWYRRRHL